MLKYVVILPVFFTSFAFSADYEKGAVAYKQGNYQAAIQEWQPLAEQGDAKAQFY